MDSSVLFFWILIPVWQNPLHLLTYQLYCSLFVLINYFPKIYSYFCLWNISSLNFILCPIGYFQRSFWWISTIYVSPLWINIYSDLECIAKNGSGFFFSTQLPDHMEVKNTQLKYSAKGIDLQDHYHFTKHLWTELMCSITGD